MAVTGQIFNSLTYGGVKSSDYGVYISGDAVFNAPQRAVALFSIPGRNGAFALDQGHFENISVEYPAGMFGSDKDDFRQKLSNFRNAILSKKGYQRLSDTYHPDEYREGMYIEGLEVDPVHFNEAGEFTLKFNCKPQRYLTSGETAVSVSSGNTITNPTNFDAQPLLEVKGSGEIIVNGGKIAIDSVPIGSIKIGSGGSSYANPQTVTLDTALLNSGDTIYTDGLYGGYVVDSYWSFYTDATITGISVISGHCSTSGWSGNYFYLDFHPTFATNFAYGTSAQYTDTTVVKVHFGSSETTITFDYTVSYNGSNTITMTRNVTITGSHISSNSTGYSEFPAWWGQSSRLANPNPLYIDLEIGEAYGVQSGETLQFNNHVSLPPTLPVLSPGANTITYDNTITTLKVTPRWWKV